MSQNACYDKESESVSSKFKETEAHNMSREISQAVLVVSLCHNYSIDHGKLT